MARWLLLLLTTACLIVGPMGRCATAAGPAGGETPRNCCDPDLTKHGAPGVPCWSMACCVLFAPALAPVTLTGHAPCGVTIPAEILAPDTHSVRPPTPPPRAAGIV